ncbi:hypothetical protein ABMA27_009801 [Loxostege sticticalis]|uniref:DUF7869 domain-containing protein n=1 Tax=Loxostege sticticalis TaxID=481309 RepID=A0ABR3H6J2_LOXSC
MKKGSRGLNILNLVHPPGNSSNIATEVESSRLDDALIPLSQMKNRRDDSESNIIANLNNFILDGQKSECATNVPIYEEKENLQTSKEKLIEAKESKENNSDKESDEENQTTQSYPTDKQNNNLSSEYTSEVCRPSTSNIGENNEDCDNYTDEDIFDSDDSVKDKDYVLPTTKKIPDSGSDTDSLGDAIENTQLFFLTTLGYNRRNDKAVRNAVAENEVPIDKRGINPNPKKINNDVITQHIESFNPTISHYRREHAPNKKYLPSDLTVRAMYDDFCDKYTNELNGRKISYDHYRKVVKDLNISFAKLGHEECEICEQYLIHNPKNDLRHRNCMECRNYETHHTKYIAARAEYQRDSDMQTNADSDSDTAYFAIDLQKVIMLPRMEEFKKVMFCPRMIVFNESFVPIGEKKAIENCQTFAAICCFRVFFLQNRDFKHLVLWLDNCASQNKNWTLYSYMIHLINSAEVSFDSITFKYLEVGHTYMAADEFHHRVELAMKKKKRIYDFEDFHQAVLNTSKNNVPIVKKMNVEDFCKFEDCSSVYKLQNSSPRAYLKDMCQITFRRGHNVLFYKTDFEDEEYTLDFLKLKNIKNGIPHPKRNNTCRGITSQRKQNIITQLGPLMPESRRLFWEHLPVNDRATDLTQCHDE